MPATDINHDIRVGFISKLTGSSSPFRTAVAVTVAGVTYYRVYYDEVRQDYGDAAKTHITPPWVVMSILPITQSRDTAVKFYRCTVQLTVAALTQLECDSVAGKLCDLLEDSEASLSFEGYFTVEVNREAQTNMPKSDEVYSTVVQYSILIQR